MSPDEFQMLNIRYGPVLIAVRIRWMPIPGGGALRVGDGLYWEGARLCQRCLRLVGYDHGDIDAVLEAQRLGLAHAPCVASCERCGKATCERCAERGCSA